ncbi:MAG: hypothetical protein NZ879_00920 [Archaeoglobaceae archaeon]|nr:hypothetical protein [Archaeoglobaceae archaeon]MDW8117528.1 hypothetical protein [Archaeoglobaceae archaeon]
MPIDVWIAASYVMDFVQGLAIFFGTILRTIAVNSTIANETAEGLYYFFGHLKYFSDFIADHIYYVYNNTTTMNFSVRMWQKTANNSTIIFGDWNATKGMAYLWNVGYQCIQPTYYCTAKGPETVYWVLQFFKQLFSALGRVGERLILFYV